MVRPATKQFEESNPPEGFGAATGEAAQVILDQVPPARLDADATEKDAASNRSDFQLSHEEKQAGGLDHQQEQPLPQRQSAEQRRERPQSPDGGLSPHHAGGGRGEPLAATAPNEIDAFENGYHFPPARPWTESFKLGTIAFLKWSITPLGFFVVLYGVLVVGWGGMLFLLLCNAAPAMCVPTCNDINAPRRVWLEIDCQILTVLFCLTGFGLAPWRFRDLYYLLQYQLRDNIVGLRRLAGIHRSWFRLEGSQLLAPDIGPQNIHDLTLASSLPCVPYPEKEIPNRPLTGIRAPPTALWKMYCVVWTFVINTFLQAVLCGFMWGMNRYTRPSWATGLFVALGMVTGAAAGYMQFSEGRAVKRIEGVPLNEGDIKRLENDKELGVTHYNNIKDKKPKDNADKLSIHHRLSRHKGEGK